MIVIVIALVVVVIGGISIYKFTGTPTVEVNVFEDFKTIKRAIADFNKANLTQLKQVAELKPYVPKDNTIVLSNYMISADEKFLIAKEGSKIKNKEDLIERIGSTSFYDKEKDWLYLALYQFKMSEVEPVAKINYFPKDNLTTTSKIEWKHDESVVEAKEFKEVEWKNKKERYETSGDHVVELRVKDRNNNWSEWASVTITITEEQGVKSIAAYGGTVYKVFKSGKIQAFGCNKYGQIGDGSLNDYEKLKTVVNIENVAQMACGETFTLVKAYDGSAYGFGNNDHGQLGIGSKTLTRAPKKIWGLDHVKQIAAGSDYSAALLASGAVLTWGNNEFGQLGNPDESHREQPKRVKDVSSVKQLSLGATHAIAVLHDGTVMGWGDNSHGQLGTGFKSKVQEPTFINVSGVFYAAAGKNFSIFVLDNGKVKCLGHNNASQLGMQSESDVLFAKEIPALKSIVKAMAHDNFVVAMTDIGEVYTWGKYSSKDGETHQKPQKLNGLKYVKDIGVTNGKGYALKDDGTIARWGGNIDLIEVLDEL